jgi:hypothetical protein
MHVSDVTTNLATGLLAAVVASIIMGLGDLDLDLKLEMPDELRAIFFAVTGIVAITNVTGKPKGVVDGQWEETIFGDKFFPFEELNNTQKRVLTGTMESIGILLTLMTTGHEKLRACGYGILCVMYGRGSMINVRIKLDKAVFTACVSVMAALLSLAELQILTKPEIQR